MRQVVGITRASERYFILQMFFHALESDMHAAELYGEALRDVHLYHALTFFMNCVQSDKDAKLPAAVSQIAQASEVDDLGKLHQCC